MGPSGALARTWLRRNVVATVALVVFVALASGAAFGAFAAARRASSSLDRFLEFNRPPVLQVYGEAIDVEAVEGLSEVTGSSQGAYGLMTVQSETAGPFPPGVVNPFITTRVAGERSFRPLVVDGREPAIDAADEVAIDEEAASRLGTGVGDVLRVRFFLPEQIDELYESGGDFPEPRGEGTELTVTGIVRHPFDLNPTKPEDVDAVMLASADIHLPEGFWAANGDRMAAFGGDGDGTELLLRNGVADVDTVTAAIRAMPGGEALAIEQRNDSLDAIADARQTVRFESIALVVVGVLSALVAAVIVGQALTRQIRTELAQRHVLMGIGLTRSDLGKATAARMSVVAGVGPLGGVVIAWLSSSWTPIGFARRAEIDPGLRFDAVIIVPGALVMAIAVLAWAAWSGWRVPSGRSRSRLGIGGGLAAAAARSGAPALVVAGLSQLATGRTGSRTPLRSGLGAVAFSIGSVVAVAVFASSMDQFIDDPAEHGWTWDVIAGDSDDGRLLTEGPRLLASNDDVSGFASVWIGYEDFITGQGHPGDIPVVGIETLAGDTYVALSEGEIADGDDEVVLGRRTMEDLGVGLGDDVTLRSVSDEATFRVVGVGVLHELVSGSFELDEGAVMSPAGLSRLFAGAEDITVSDTEFAGGTLLARFLIDGEPGVDVSELVSSVRADFGPTVIPHLSPLDVASLDSTRRLPAIFGALVGLLGVASLVHVLLVTVRRRRQEFAVLASLGARRGQLAATVASLATALVGLALVPGVPLGLVAGRAGWLALADALGAPTRPVVPVLAVVSVVVGIVVLANAVAAVPGHLARRLHPAETLRSE